MELNRVWRRGLRPCRWGAVLPMASFGSSLSNMVFSAKVPDRRNTDYEIQ